MAARQETRNANELKFEDLAKLALQQEESRLSPFVEVTHHQGQDIAMIQLFGATEAHVTSREIDFPDTIYNVTPQTRRWLTFENIHWAEKLPPHSDLERSIDIMQQYVKSSVAAINRKRDRAILRGMYGNNILGPFGGIIEQLNTNCIVRPKTPAAGEAKTIAHTFAGQIARAKSALRKNHVVTESEHITLAIPEQVWLQMYETDQVVSRDYSSHGVIDRGDISTYMGVNIIHYENVAGSDTFDADIVEQLPKGTSGFDTKKNYYCPMWCTSGMRFGWWNGIETRFDYLPTKQHTQQVVTYASFGASRLEPKKIVMLEVPKVTM